jgi:hypothetical protein
MNISLLSVITTSILSVALLLPTISISKPIVGNTKLSSSPTHNNSQDKAVSPKNSSLKSTSNLPRLALAQSTEVICANGSTTYAKAETKGYYVNICGDSDGPNRYLGAGKSGQAIVLPLQSHSTNKYIAVSGNIRYTLTPNYLTVTQSGRTILKQKVINWR